MKPALVRCSRAGDAGDAEVHDLQRARLGQHQVRRLQVPMHDAHAVRVRQRRQRLHGTARPPRSAGSAPAALDQVLERLAAHELHDHQPLVVALKQLVDRGDAGMVQPRDRHRLGAEPPRHFGIVQLGVEHLDRDFAIEGLVERAIDGTHAAAADAVEHTILADGLANHLESFSRARGSPEREIRSLGCALWRCQTSGGGATAPRPFDGCLVAVAPFLPRAGVVADVREAQPAASARYVCAAR